MKRKLVSECIASLVDIKVHYDHQLDPNLRLKLDELIVALGNIDVESGNGHRPDEAERVLQRFAKFVALVTNVSDLIDRWKN